MGSKIKLLLEPIIINTLKLRNRIVMSPMDCNFAGLNGEITERMIDHYEKRAKGGVGLIIVEATSVVSDAKNLVLQPVISSDCHIVGFENLVEHIHAWGAKTILQIMHPGNEAAVGPLLSPSNVASRVMGVAPTPLTVEQIEDLIERFIKAAGRAQKAGFDGIELHGAHGYLVNQFMSPFYNRRTDNYGGSIENRARFAVRVINGIKEALGKSFNICVRISADELIDGGLTVQESKEFVKLFQAAGADLLHVSAGIYDSAIFHIAPPGMPQGLLIPMAKAIKVAVNIPVIAVGRMVDPMIAEKFLAEGSADLIAFGRALLADAELARKIQENRLDEIRKCIGCRYCNDRNSNGLDVKCAVNPALGREKYFDDTAVAQKPKKVLIIGSGPGGMQAAISANKLGHNVTLFEKEKQLGGQLNIAVIPYFKEVHYLLDYLKTQIKKLKVNVKLGQEANLATVKRFKPDVVIVATGAREIRLSDLKFDRKNVMTAWEALLKPQKVGKRVVVIGGGGTGCETAEFLAGKKVELEYLGVKGQGPDLKYRVNPAAHPSQEREVMILEMLDDVATDTEDFARQLLLLRLKENGVKILTRAKVKEIHGNKVTFLDGNTQETKSIEADTFVLSVGVESKKELLNQLEKTGLKVLAIGDCVKPGRIQDVIYQAAMAAKQI